MVTPHPHSVPDSATVPPPQAAPNQQQAPLPNQPQYATFQDVQALVAEGNANALNALNTAIAESRRREHANERKVNIYRVVGGVVIVFVAGVGSTLLYQHYAMKPKGVTK